ncbi:MAG: hypothetical protein HQK50_07685 [Oligoflexia bacterium]|nr:hypothetical protein [Oligoflexia bacterium]
MKKLFCVLILAAVTASTVSVSVSASVGAGDYGCGNSGSIDLSQRLGAVRNQGVNGLCWAYSAAAAMRNELCREGHPRCGDASFQPSIPDATACARKNLNIFPVGKESSGGRPERALSCMLGKGVCSEENASIEKYRQAVKGMGEFCPIDPCASDKSSDMKNYIDNLANATQQSSVHGFGDENSDEYALLNLPPKAACVYKSVIGESCKRNRAVLREAKTVAPQTLMLLKKSSPEVMEILNNLLKSDKTPILAVCLDNVAIPELQKGLAAAEKAEKAEESGAAGRGCGNAHAVTIGGVRCHNGEAEYYVHNSWGKNAPFHGWIPASKFIAASLDVTFIGKK